MVQNFGYQDRPAQNRANEERIESADLLEPTLSSTERFFPIFKVQGTKTQVFAPGYGSQHENLAQGWSDLNLKDNSTSPVNIGGKARWALYSDSTLQDPIYYSNTFSLSNLRSAESAARKDKALMPGQVPAAGDDRVLALEVSPNAGSEGLTVGSAESSTDLGVPYSLFR